jgi:hypothetical protein
MIIYYINFLALSLLALPWLKFPKKLFFYYKIFTIIYLFIFLATRIDVGGDYQNVKNLYSYSFYSYGKDNAFSILPIILDGGFLIALRGFSNQIVGNLLIVLSWFGLEYRFYIFFSSFIFLLGFFALYIKNKNFFFITAMSCSWFILVAGMGYIRQSISVGLVMLSIYFIVYKKKIIISIFFSSLSIMFHSSAIIFLIFYIFLIKKLYLRSSILICIFTIVTLGVLVYPEIFLRLGSAEQSPLKILRIATHLPSLVFIILYWRYLKNSLESKLYLYYGFICTLIIPLIFFFTIADYQFFEKKDSFILLIYDRLLIIVIPIQLLLISSIINLQKKNIALYLKSSILIVYFMLLHLWFVYSWNSRAWFPYKSILFLE